MPPAGTGRKRPPIFFLADQDPGMSNSSGAYDLLPSSHDGELPASQKSRWQSTRFSCPVSLSRRYVRVILGVIVGFASLILVYRLAIRESGPKNPPLYEEYHRKELALPQHNADLPLPEGRDGKYLFVSSHLDNYGWGNFMQELVWDAFLAHKAGRSFVFDNYTWDRHGPEYSVYKGNLIPSRVPLSAMLSGPIVGGPYPPDDGGPRSVRKEYYDKVCPEPTQISGNEVVDQYVFGSTAILIEKWLEKFEAVGDKCIEITEGTTQPFGLWTFGTTNVLEAWGDFIQSPILKTFRWSRLIEDGFARNIRRILPSTRHNRVEYGETYPYTSLPGLLVLQIRRGDYEEHCFNLLNWGANWQGFNKFPSFPDQFSPVPGAGTENITEEARAEHLKRCLPEPGQVADRVREILASEAGQGLHSVYIMTNAKAPFIADVKEQLKAVKDWSSIKSSRDLVVNHEQQYVKQAIDMLIGLRSQVIIGNGWSSMSSNIVMLRMGLLDISPDHNRYW